MTYFTYRDIADLLAELDASYGLFPLSAWRGQCGIILRHDVDLDVHPAFELSRRELDRGIRGSFFFLVTASSYNCESRRNRSMIRQMADDGFEIGLHFDPSLYAEVSPEDLGVRARAEAAQLESICGRRVNSVSLHNPSVANEYPMLPGWLNAYDDAIFDPSIYLSDSRMSFRSDPRTFFERANERTHQLLLHPMHYAESEPLYPRAKLDLLKRIVDELDETFRPNSTYQARVGNRLIEMIQREVADWK